MYLLQNNYNSNVEELLKYIRPTFFLKKKLLTKQKMTFISLESCRVNVYLSHL